MRIIVFLILLLGFNPISKAQKNWDAAIAKELPKTLQLHRQFVSIPNVASQPQDIFKNYDWIKPQFENVGFQVQLLPSDQDLPVFLAKRTISPKAKTILFYFHIDGQAVDASLWDQDNPFVPVLKKQTDAGNWEAISWDSLNTEVNPDWRVFGRSSADDKAPILMILTALKLLDQEKKKLPYNIKVILDPQEEAGSEAFLSTLEEYKNQYQADYMIIMDGPAHPSNKPTLTFGCRGIATCSITTYGAKLPQHSGHYGNYSPNPMFTMAHLLASMKDDEGKVLIDSYYKGIVLDEQAKAIMAQVPDNESAINEHLLIKEADKVGANYQESLQYPSLNVRHIETTWKGPGLKTIIPESVTAHLDIRLVKETDGAAQLEKIRGHIVKQGFYITNEEPTDAERLANTKIVKFTSDAGVNAFRTELDHPFAVLLSNSLEEVFGEPPVKIRTMGGTVPIIPAINKLNIPAIIVPMVNMDNNQHSPNENMRIGNFSDGIKMCMVILSMKLK